ncbi:MAG: hypothetical protein KBE09_04530 [Candidatus Pacebacteria bacterium]|nr:hypothetical protein [Candidatus Paceibacterota bacterium]
MIAKEPEYISLKEAAKISGYTADYLGQLIRGGKLPGKQVFSNVAWVTTEDAVYEYVRNGRKQDDAALQQVSFSERMMQPEVLGIVYAVMSWTVIAVLGIFILFLGYVLAVSVDHRIERAYMAQLEQQK